MSRIGRAPITVPAGVEITLKGHELTVKGPKGTLVQELHPDMKFELEDGTINISRPSEQKMHKSLHGLTRSLVFNMVEGVTNGFKKELEVNGVGYRVALDGKKLVMNLGYSHQVIMEAADGVEIEVPSPNKIIVSGINKQKVGQFAAEVRSKRPPEPYKGKGIKYAGEHIRRKEGKTGAK